MLQNSTNKCPVSNLPLITLPEFTDINMKGDYHISFIKIGDSIVYMSGHGNLKNYDIDQFNSTLDAFCAKANVKPPYVQIRDMTHITGRLSFQDAHRQKNYLLDSQDTISGFITVKDPVWMKVLINHGVRYFSPKTRYVSVDDYASAISIALRILDWKEDPIVEESFPAERFSMDDVVFSPNWEYINEETGCIHRIGTIYSELLFISIEGAFTSEREVNSIALTLDRALKDSGLEGSRYIGITQLAATERQPPLKLRVAYSMMISSTLKRNSCKPTISFVCGADTFMRSVVRLLSPIIGLKFTFVDTLEQAFQSVKSKDSGNSKTDTSASHVQSSFVVSPVHLEEIDSACGNLLWGSDSKDTQISVSPDNPLKEVAHTLEIVMQDLKEMRENERSMQEQRLQESEANRMQLLGTMNDTEAARIALEKEQESKRILLNNIKTQVWYLTDEVTYGAVNKAHAEFSGLNIDDIAFKRLHDVFPDDIVRFCSESNAEVFNTKQAVYIEEWMPNFHGEQRLLAITKTPKLRPNGTVEYVVCSADDITERKQKELVIERQNIELTEFNANKDRFIQILAHDLKNPFASLIGITELLDSNYSKYDTDKIKLFIANINSLANSTYNLLEELLTWTMSQSGQLKFKPKKRNLQRVLSSILEGLEQSANAKEIIIRPLVGKSDEVFADRNMLSTILRNLITNAIKFTHNGGVVEISAKQTPSDVIVSISDNGVGIDEDSKGNLFDISHKTTTEGTANEQGTGLGLLLCKDFVEKHGGQIWVESRKGEGSKFIFSLPKKR